MDNNEGKKYTLRIITRIITLLFSIPFIYSIFLIIGFSTDNPNQDLFDSLIRWCFFIVPIILLIISLISKKLYWLWLSIMVIILMIFYVNKIYREGQITKENSEIISENKSDFICYDPYLDSSYLSIKENGDILNITGVQKSISTRRIGFINNNGGVNFTEINEKYKDFYLNCKNVDGKFLKDVYNNITFLKIN